MSEFLYQQLAGKLGRMIEEEVLKVGEKLPSVRTLSREQGVSMSTAFQTYLELERKGLVESRPRSGYYVRFSPRRLRNVSEKSSPVMGRAFRDVEDIIQTVYRKISDKNVIPLSINMPALELLPAAKLRKSMLHFLRTKSDDCLLYEDVQGSQLLREQVARLVFNSGVVATEEEVVITAGCMEAMNFAIQATTEVGDTIAIESPTYFGIFQAVEAAGRIPIEAPTHPRTGVDLEALRRIIPEQNVKACLFVTNFSNPLGATIPTDNKKRLVELLEQFGVPLIENDIYGEMYFGKERPRTCKSFDRTGNVLLCSSVSKSLAPGYRVGWILPGKFYDEVFKTKLHQTINTSRIPQEVVAHFLERGRFDLHMRQLRKKLHTQSLRYLQAIYEHFPDSVRVTQPEGGFVLWIELPKHLNGVRIFSRSMEKGISIAPGQMFSRQSDFSNFLRISFGSPFSGEIDRAIRVLGGMLTG
jgi:DNA-binding transcriptional MocR family regulator